jgi:hypothetical protein
VTLSRGQPALAGQVREALRSAAQAGPFFRLELHGGASAPGWLPVAELGRAGLASLTEDAARQLGTGEIRVTASILQLGLAARLWSPVLGSGLLSGVIPDLSSLVLSTEPPIRLGIASLSGWLVSSPGQLAVLSADVVGQQLTTLTTALPASLPDGLLRGNSASAMVGALGVLARRYPDLAEAANEVARYLLEIPELAGAGDLAENHLGFRRRSCCLYYRVPGGGLCGDCCFDVRPDIGGRAEPTS